MRLRTLSSVLQRWLSQKGYKAMRVVPQGKVKPIDLHVVEVLEDGFLAIDPEDMAQRVYPFATLMTIEPVLAAPPEDT